MGLQKEGRDMKNDGEREGEEEELIFFFFFKFLYD